MFRVYVGIDGAGMLCMPCLGSQGALLASEFVSKLVQSQCRPKAVNDHYKYEAVRFDEKFDKIVKEATNA